MDAAPATPAPLTNSVDAAQPAAKRQRTSDSSRATFSTDPRYLLFIAHDEDGFPRSYRFDTSSTSTFRAIQIATLFDKLYTATGSDGGPIKIALEAIRLRYDHAYVAGERFPVIHPYRAEMLTKADDVLGPDWTSMNWGTWSFWDEWNLPPATDGRTYLCPSWD